MYSLKSKYYDKEFETINELVDDCLLNGVDMNYEVLENGKEIGNLLIEFISE